MVADNRVERVIASLETELPNVSKIGPPPYPRRKSIDLAALGICPVDWSELWALELSREEWSIPLILPRGREGGIFGPPAVGKSLLTLDVAAAKATGRSVLGTEPQEPMEVVYIDAEMNQSDLQERLADLGYGPGDDLSHLHYYQLQMFPSLDTIKGGNILMTIIERDKPETVILDTMTALVEGEESSADTYRAFHRNTARRIKSAGVSLLRIDHQGKNANRGQRGSSAKGDEADVIWQLTNDGAQLVLKNTKRRIPYVPTNVVIVRETNPVLRHVAVPTATIAETVELANLLDELGVPIDVTAAAALQALKEAGQGRRKQVVQAAHKLRRERSAPVPGTTIAASCISTSEPTDE